MRVLVYLLAFAAAAHATPSDVVMTALVKTFAVSVSRHLNRTVHLDISLLAGAWYDYMCEATVDGNTDFFVVNNGTTTSSSEMETGLERDWREIGL